MGYCGCNDNIILAIVVPFESEMTSRHTKGPFQARIEMIKRSCERYPKVELKTWQGRILEINMSYLFGLCFDELAELV